MNEQQIKVIPEQTEQRINVGSEPSVLHGIDGVSPIATVEQTATGATILITDKNGTTTADIEDGKDGVDGQDGRDGVDGVSATIAVGQVQTGSAGSSAVITNVGTSRDAVFNFTIPRGDKGEAGQDGTNGQDGRDGTDGQDGQDGQDGYSPTATVVKTGDTATITITDKNGTTTASIKDGSDATITIDDALSPTSENPVKNSTIYNAIGNVESVLATLNNGGGAQ